MSNRVSRQLDGVGVAHGEVHAGVAVAGSARAGHVARHAGGVVAAVGRIQQAVVARTNSISIELELAPQDRRIIDCRSRAAVACASVMEPSLAS